MLLMIMINNKIINKLLENAQTTHNKRLAYAASRRLGFRRARSVALRARSHALLHPQFASPANATHLLIQAVKPSPT